MSGNEIATLQFGNYSNYIGTHFWNIEDEAQVYNDPTGKTLPEINPDLLLRINEKGTAYTPRLVLFDVAAAFGSLSSLGTTAPSSSSSSSGSSTGETSSDVFWDGKIRVYNSEKVKKNDYLKSLETSEDTPTTDLKAKTENYSFTSDNVKYWSDFAKTHYDSNALGQLPAWTPLDFYSQGLVLHENSTLWDDLLDRFRKISEACGRLQGINSFIDIDSGFGGFAKTYLLELRDDYPKIPIFTMTNVISKSKATTVEPLTKTAINVALAYRDLSSFSAMIPLSIEKFPELNYDGSWFHSSAIFGSALHTATTGYRLSKSRADMDSYLSVVCPSPRANILSLSTSFPLHFNSSIFNNVDSRMGLSLSSSSTSSSSTSSSSTPSPFYSSIHSLSPILSSSYNSKGDTLIGEWVTMRGYDNLIKEQKKKNFWNSRFRVQKCQHRGNFLPKHGKCLLVNPGTGAV